jgi:serine/threonine protein kinase
MAPESLKAAKFSNKTDVWAFGVLCWEITSLGQIPYGAIGIKDMVDSLEHGDRLVEAPFTPPGLHKVLLLCWSLDPKRRPSFAGLVHNLGAIRGAIAVSLEARITLDATGALVSVDTGATIEEVRAAHGGETGGSKIGNNHSDVANLNPSNPTDATDGYETFRDMQVVNRNIQATTPSFSGLNSDGCTRPIASAQVQSGNVHAAAPSNVCDGDGVGLVHEYVPDGYVERDEQHGDDARGLAGAKQGPVLLLSNSPCGVDGGGDGFRERKPSVYEGFAGMEADADQGTRL